MTATKNEHGAPGSLLLVIGVAGVVGVAALILSVVNALAIGAVSDRREVERLASDYASCQRGNAFRQQVRDLGVAEDERLTGVLDTVLPIDSQNPRVAELRAELEPLAVEYRAVVESIKITDCEKALPGGKAALEAIT